MQNVKTIGQLINMSPLERAKIANRMGPRIPDNYKPPQPKNTRELSTRELARQLRKWGPFIPDDYKHPDDHPLRMDAIPGWESRFPARKPDPTYQNFISLFKKNAGGEMKFSSGDFVMDKFNQPIIDQLFYYATKSGKFSGSHNRGFLLMGAYGSGKTLIMEAYIKTIKQLFGKGIRSIRARDISTILTAETDRYNFQVDLTKVPLFVDDIGKEQTTVNTYGTISKPFEDLISDRYHNEAITLGTSNLKLDDMPYNEHTMDRMRQMFNVIILPGKSRR